MRGLRKLLEPLAMEIERMLRAAEAWDTALGIENVAGPVSLEPEAFGHWERRIGECAERLEKAGYAPQAEQLRAYLPSRDPDEVLDVDGILKWFEEQRKESAPERENRRLVRGEPHDEAGGQAQAPEEPWEADEPDPFAELRKLADEKMKGKQRRIVESIVDAGGSKPIGDLAIEMEWANPTDNFNSQRREINKKLEAIGWELIRQDNQAILMAR